MADQHQVNSIIATAICDARKEDPDHRMDPEEVKLFTLLGPYVRKYHGSRYYGKAMKITRLLTAAYDQALAQYDLLLNLLDRRRSGHAMRRSQRRAVPRPHSPKGLSRTKRPAPGSIRFRR